MFTGAFCLGFIGENHFAHGVAAGDRGIEDGHDELLVIKSGHFSLDGFSPKATEHVRHIPGAVLKMRGIFLCPGDG
jgi:hypothetical protein